MNKSSLYPVVIVFLVIFISGNRMNLNAQELNRIDSKGQKQGKWVKEYSNGAIRYEGTFKDNRPIGKFKYYYPNGKLKAVTLYGNDGRTAYAKTFQLNGRMLAEGKYIDRKRDSTWRFYSDTDSTLISEITYKNGVLDGKKIIWFPENGKPSKIIEYKNGKKNGQLQEFYTDGKPARLETYRNDTLNGPFKVWFPEGRLQIEGSYKNGYQDSVWKTYDKNGKLIKRETYSKGFLIKSPGK